MSICFLKIEKELESLRVDFDESLSIPYANGSRNYNQLLKFDDSTFLSSFYRYKQIILKMSLNFYLFILHGGMLSKWSTSAC